MWFEAEKYTSCIYLRIDTTNCFILSGQLFMYRPIVICDYKEYIQSPVRSHKTKLNISRLIMSFFFLALIDETFYMKLVHLSL